jgi:hypothetical protein
MSASSGIYKGVASILGGSGGLRKWYCPAPQRSRPCIIAVSFRPTAIMGGGSADGDGLMEPNWILMRRKSSPIYEGRGRKAGGSCCLIMWAMAEALNVVELEGRWEAEMEIRVGEDAQMDSSDRRTSLA